MSNGISRLIRQWRTERQVMRRWPSTGIEDQVVFKGNLDNLVLGKNVILQSGSVLHSGGLDWCLGVGHLELGDGTCISPNCVIYGTGPGGVYIGKRFDCGPGVGIFASRTDFTPGHRGTAFGRVQIGDDVVVFAHAVISPGVTIGDGAVIAANSVVTGDVPHHCMVGGAPARIVKDFAGLGRADWRRQPCDQERPDDSCKESRRRRSPAVPDPQSLK